MEKPKGLVIMIGGKGPDAGSYKDRLGGKGTDKSAYAKDEEASEPSEDMDQQKVEAYREFAKAVKSGNEKDGVAALEAFIESCNY